jgi:cobalt-zinc-cadmium efflux system outer membrane protein
VRALACARPSFDRRPLDLSRRFIVKKLLCVAANAPTALASARGRAAISRSDVVDCVLRASLALRVESQTAEALEGRRTALAPLLPTNPVLSLSGARRDVGGSTVTNWSASLEQQIEIAGQRSARRHAAELEQLAQGHRIVATRRETAALAWLAYFDALSSAEELRLTSRLTVVSAQIANVARAMADRGALAPVDADVADAARVSIDQSQLAAERRSRTTGVTLGVLLGSDSFAPVTVSGDLEPLRGVEEEARIAAGRDASERPEVQAFEAEKKAQEATATAFGRARVPNVTVSAFAQNDGFNERVFGVGVAFPIPLPQPVGRTFNGEIAEANALARRAGTEAERARRQARGALLGALADYDTRRREREAFTPERIARAQQGIDAIAREIEAGRLALRDALVSEQALIGLLRAAVDARHALCVASVELARAAGLPLERGPR